MVALPLVLPLWGFASDEGSPGAGDNMAASAIALEIFKEFAERRAAGAGLKRTRLAFASFDAEEAGLRGARVFARRCKGEPCGHALGQRCSGQCLPHPGGHHTPADTPEAVDPAAVEALLNLGLRFAEDIDAKIL